MFAILFPPIAFDLNLIIKEKEYTPILSTAIPTYTHKLVPASFPAIAAIRSIFKLILHQII